MNPDQTEKLKGLIRTSPILNENERQEWLTLLGLMNDKQAAELEKILTAAGASARPQAFTPASSNRPGPAFGVGVLPGRGGGQEEMAPVGHVVNFPKIKEVDSSFPQAEQKQAETAKPKSNFSSRLQSVLAEKELPPGHPEAVEELELPAPKSQSTPIQGLQRGPDKDLQRSNALSRMNHIQNLPAVSHSAAAPQQFPAKEKLPIVPKPKPPAARTQAPAGADAGQPTGIEASSVKASFSAASSPSRLQEVGGVKLQGGLSANQLERRGLQTGLEKWPEFKQGAMSAGTSKTHEGLGLENLSEVGTLSVYEFSQHFVEDFEKKLKALIKKHGYHNVLFNLEKSPLYEAYLNTGTQILGGKSDFEELKSQRAGGRLGEKSFLSRSEFENFADLLRRIQMGS